MKPLATLLLSLTTLIGGHAGSGHADALKFPKPVQEQDYRTYSPQMVKLGQLLFYDRVLSGTYRVSCATCHNPDRASSNGFRTDQVPDDKGDNEGDDLAINGLPLYEALKPSAKHAPALFNLGAREFTIMFGDGRVAERSDGSFLSPAGDQLPDGLQDVLAVQALFPAVTGDELVGTVDNDVKAVAHLGNRAIWQALTERVQYLEEYWQPFKAAYPKLNSREQINITHIANAISAFVGTEWRSDSTPFDAWLRGEKAALSPSQTRGMDTFYGKAGCSSCHSGPFQTDHGFHPVAMPLWRFDVDLFATGDTVDLHQDRSKLTGNDSDKYHRRTPSLRNVEWTAPYGHAGSYETLAGFMNAHLDPVAGLQAFVAKRSAGKSLPNAVQTSVDELKASNKLPAVKLSDQEFADLLAFLKSLSQADSLTGNLGRPEIVPSSLALD
ncbi:MAG: c-type cytochrome [Rhizobiaceae bacterium]|nr:c-type cytochrome [Rhizobiaceae bacterium]